MFRNDNKQTPKKLAHASLRHSLQRNAFIMVSIILAASMIMAVSLFFSGLNRADINDSHDRYQATIPEKTLAEADVLRRNNPELELGLTSLLDYQQVEDYRISYSYMDEAMLRMGKFPALQGRLPQEADEVAVEADYLSHISSGAGVGDSISLTINNVRGSYTISGILPRENGTRSYTVIVSQALLSEQMGTPLYSLYVRVKDSDGWDTNDITQKITETVLNSGIAEDELIFSSFYFSMHDSFSPAETMVTIVVAIIIALACAVVIYSLFYVSVVGKTQEYGLLRIIGTTKKQVERIVYREALILCILSLPVGAVLGGLVGYLLIPDGWHWPTAIVTAVFACVILLLVVLAAARKPVRLAAKVTPVEAMRHTSYADDRKDKDTKKLYRRLSPRTLAGINMGRNKKKTVLTILSLGICGILLMIGATFLSSIDYEDMARLSFPRGELIIELGVNGPGAYTANDFAREQESNPFTDVLMQSIAEVDGVEEVFAYRGAFNNAVLPSGMEEPFMFHACSREDEEALSGDLLSGTLSYDALMNGKGVVVADADIWQLFSWVPALGDIITVKTPSGETVELTVMGIRKDTDIGSGYSQFFIPDGLLARLLPGIENPAYQVTVKTEQGKTDQVEAAVRELISSNPNTYIRTMKDWAAAIEGSLDKMKTPVFLLVFFIGIFGLINLTNTLMTNVVVRKKELSVLQTLGLTGRQLRWMLLEEGLYYVLGTIILTLSAGTLCGYLLCQSIDTIGTMGKLIYHFPGIQVAVYLAAVVLVQVLFSFVSMNTLRKESLVERIREG